jgi:small subunit ribosomal protein S16
MAVRIRLTRKGKKKQPTYRVVVADQRAARDGRYIEQIGRYDPRQDPSVVVIDNDRAHYWLDRGAQPSDAVRKLFEISGALEARKMSEGKIHVVGADAQKAAADEDAARAAAAETETDEEAGPGAEESAEGEDGAEEVEEA